MTKYVKVSDFFYHVINYSLFTSEPEIDLIFFLNLVNFNLPRDFFRQNFELGKSRGKAPKAVTRVCLGLGPEPHQNFFRKKIPTNAVARAVQSFGRNGPWLAGWLSKGKNFFVNLAQTLDEHLLKISAQ